MHAARVGILRSSAAVLLDEARDWGARSVEVRKRHAGAMADHARRIEERRERAAGLRTQSFEDD
jgi:hypothetical protein